MQLVDTLSGNWKKNLKLSDTNSQNLILLYHHLVKFNSLFSIGKLESRELYCIINSSRNNKPTLQIYLKRILIRRIGLEGHSYITTNTYLRLFQYKILKNILYLNEKTFWLWTFYNTILILLQFFWWKYHTFFIWLYNNTMSLVKITVEIETWSNSSSTKTTGCHFWFPWIRLSILHNPKPHSSHFETVHI